MSSAKLSSVIQRRVIKILKEDLRAELNMLMPELELDRTYTQKFLKKEYNLDNNEAKKVFNFIISDIKSRSTFERKKGVKGKRYIFYPGKSKAKNRFKAVSSWKNSISKKLEKKFNIGGFSSKFHLGHGSSSIPTVAYRALKAGQYLAGKDGAEAMIGVINSSPLIKDFTVGAKVHTVFNQKQGLKKNYTVRIKLQYGEENIQESAVEKKENKKLIEHLERMAIEEETSPSSLKLISKAIDNSIRGKKVRSIKSKSVASITYKNPKKGKKGKKAIILPLRDKKGRFTSPLNIQTLLQSRISTQVAENMGEAGALKYRTGRFAESVVIMKVTRQRVLTAYYTYMKYPYQTFERGFAQGSFKRDPRVLISKSIREIAAGIVNERFNIRRV